MRFMVMVKASRDSEAGVMPSEQLLAEMGKFNEELVQAGIMLAGEGLHPSSKGVRVHFSGKRRTVIDAGDAPDNVPYEGIKGVAITLNYATVAEAERVFKALSEGVKVTMPLQPTFWAKIWGMCVDRFGTPWIINGERIPLRSK